MPVKLCFTGTLYLYIQRLFVLGMSKAKVKKFLAAVAFYYTGTLYLYIQSLFIRGKGPDIRSCLINFGM